MCNLDVRIREREGDTFFFFFCAFCLYCVGVARCVMSLERRREIGVTSPPRTFERRSNAPIGRSKIHCSRSYSYNATHPAPAALSSASRSRVPPQSPQVLPSVVEGVSSPLEFPTQHLQPSLGRGVERRRRVRPRARAGRADARERRVSAGVVVLTAGREEHGPRDVCFPPDARWGEDVGVARRERALQPTHRLLEVAAHGVHELAAHDVASPNRLDARRRAESRLHRGARARRLCVDAVWGSDFLNARLSVNC